MRPSPVALLALVTIWTGCSLDATSRGPFGPNDPETALTKATLPPTVPTPHRLEFVSDDAAGHVKPNMAGTVAAGLPVRTPNTGVVLSTQQIQSLRRAAESDPRVAALLGPRWGFVEAYRVPPDGKVSFGCCRKEASVTRLLYYSYSHNTAVDVRMTESGVLSVERADGYLPPEGPQDIQRGIELARTDSRLAGKVQQLEGHGLLMQPDRGFFRNDPGFAHRVIWITFSQGQDGDPKYWAVVDLTEDRVLDAGEEPARS
ncbi:MAG: hypothetical protein KF814_09345 [Nitrospiraceae bacterium]|nr:hypothetical protein [Nitrospiraceae bacterium]